MKKKTIFLNRSPALDNLLMVDMPLNKQNQNKSFVSFFSSLFYLTYPVW